MLASGSASVMWVWAAGQVKDAALNSLGTTLRLALGITEQAAMWYGVLGMAVGSGLRQGCVAVCWVPPVLGMGA
jgi:hypothetical protein